MLLDINTLNDIYSPPNKSGVQKCIKKNVVAKMLVNSTDIDYVLEDIDAKGTVSKSLCIIRLKGGESFKIKHSYKEIHDIVRKGIDATPIGFSKK